MYSYPIIGRGGELGQAVVFDDSKLGISQDQIVKPIG
jgi:hypothetical protein